MHDPPGTAQDAMGGAVDTSTHGGKSSLFLIVHDIVEGECSPQHGRTAQTTSQNLASQPPS